MELTDLPDEPTRVFRLIPDWVRVRRVMYMGMFVILAMVTQYMVNAADTMMRVGRLADPQLATASQAALGLGMPLFWAVGGFFSAVSFGTQAITARRYAEGNDHATGQVLFNSLLAAIICGLLGTAVGWYSAPAAVDFFAEASEAQKALGLEYVQIRSLGIIGMVLTFSYKSFFDGIGRTYVAPRRGLGDELLQHRLELHPHFWGGVVGDRVHGARWRSLGIDHLHLLGAGHHDPHQHAGAATASASPFTGRATLSRGSWATSSSCFCPRAQLR